MDILNSLNENNIIIEREVINKPPSYDNTPRILLVDADSILYTSIYNPDRPAIQTEEDLVLDLDECKYRLDSKIQEITNNIEESFNIQLRLYFLGGSNNFRYQIYPEYKSNRPTERNPFIPILKQYFIDKYDAIPAPAGEADDLIYTAYIKSNKNCVVAAIDKDVLGQTFGVPQYNYQTSNGVLGTFTSITEEESRLKFATQALIGDSSDGINLSPGIGEKYAEKNLKLGMSNYSYIKAIFKGYLKAWKGDVSKAKYNMILTYKLVKLHDLSGEIDLKL